jgi:ribosomal protein S28E/S33
VADIEHYIDVILRLNNPREKYVHCRIVSGEDSKRILECPVSTRIKVYDIYMIVIY